MGEKGRNCVTGSESDCVGTWKEESITHLLKILMVAMLQGLAAPLFLSGPASFPTSRLAELWCETHGAPAGCLSSTS